MAGRELKSLSGIIKAAREISSDILVTSVPHKGQIGALWVSGDTSHYVGHPSKRNT